MRTAVSLFVALVVAIPVFAASSHHRHVSSAATIDYAVSEPVTGATVARAWGSARAHATSHSSAGVHTQAVADERSARTLVIPAAGSTAGGGGALFFRSDVTLVNYNAASQRVLAVFWPVGTSNPPASSGANAKLLTLPSNQAVTYVDFVATQLNLSGLGALVFIPVTSGSGFDQSAAIDGFSRIYTKQPGSTGTVSQPFDATDPDSFSVGNEAVALGLRHDTNFRTNYGIVNFDGASHTYHLKFTGERGTTTTDVTMQPYSMILTSLLAGDLGAVVITYTIAGNPTDPVSWVGFASSTDNVTGDGWVSIASADFDDAELTRNGN